MIEKRHINPKPTDVVKEVQRFMKNQQNFRESPYFNIQQGSYFAKPRNVQSSFFDPYLEAGNVYGNLLTADRNLYREESCDTLRRVSKKAWIINPCITNVIRKTRAFLKPSTNRNLKGFVIHKIGEDVRDVAGTKSETRTQIEQFLMNTGKRQSDDRDNFQMYCEKIIRDVLEIDQVATEIGYTRALTPYAFYAVDAATIEKVLPNQDNPYNIKFVQVIDGIAQAYYPEGSLIFGYQNPRSDVKAAFYGYSYVEQAIDLITSAINAFSYNAGFFTENKLPRGMLLLDGNASQDDVEQMEDYISDIMSGNPSNQWRVPILTAGNGKGGEGNSIKWVSLNGTNREMEFQGWLDFLTSAIVSLFGCSKEELGLHSSKSQPMFEHNAAPEIEASKSAILSDVLSFLQDYLNRVIQKIFPEYMLEFVGYERDDPKAILDLTKTELETYKTVNEVRKEKGLKPLEAKWADACPANPQFVQMYQAEAMNADDGGGMEDMDGENSDDGESSDTDDNADDTENQNDDGDENENVDNDAWDNMQKSIKKSLVFRL